MMRLASLVAFAAVLGACSTPEPATPAPAASVAAPAPTRAPPPDPPPPLRPVPMQLMCAGDSFRVIFEETKASVINADNTETELPLLAPPQTPGVANYTNGMMTFTKAGGRDTPTVIRFARGRMALQDCAIAAQ